MSESQWKVIGASAFRWFLRRRASKRRRYQRRPIEAPRLATRALDVDGIIDEADQVEGIIDSLAEAFAGAQVVVNAAGLRGTQHAGICPARRRKRPASRRNRHRHTDTGVRRVIHLSSTQRYRARASCWMTRRDQPFSAYSFSKHSAKKRCSTCGTTSSKSTPTAHPELCILAQPACRPRPTHHRTLRQDGLLPFASVAGAGTSKSPVSSVHASQEFVVMLGTFPASYPPSCCSLGRRNRCLRVRGCWSPPPAPPARWLCRAAVRAGYTVSS